jgi:putative aminopeptidase FrvX
MRIHNRYKVLVLGRIAVQSIPAVLLVLLSAASPAAAQPAERLLQLAQIPGPAGHETAVRDAIEMALPASARVRADNLGSMTISRRGPAGGSQVLIVAPLDEPGLVVSDIRPDGFLRVHRHTPASAHRLGAQFLVGQPVLVRTADGRFVPGVTATPSTHLNAFRAPDERARIRTDDDLWIDVGASSHDEAAALGIRLLDPVTLRERAVALAGGRVAGVAVSHRAAAQALVEAVRRQGDPPEGSKPPAVSIAWVAQSQFGNRGLMRLLDTLKPDRVVLLRGGVAPGPDPRGSVGEPGQGPVVAEGDSWLMERAKAAGISVQTVPAERLAVSLGEAHKALAVHVVTTPLLFAQTPVELVDARDVEALARLIGAIAGYGPLRADDAGRGDPSGSPSGSPDAPDPMPIDTRGLTPAAEEGARSFMATFEAIAGQYGVSGHEAPVRDAVLAQLPAWSKPEVDALGNIRVSMGEGPRPLVFVAHMDEVGFEVQTIRPDGTMSVRTRGGMFLSLYEAHPVLIHTPNGPVGAVLSPRSGYASADTAQPGVESLTLVTGATSPKEVEALGVAVGQAVTVKKKVMRLGGARMTVRAMDDRVGSAALVEALKRIDPATLTNKVTFVWSVEEETGLMGAAHVAEDLRAQKVHTAFAVDTFVSTDTPVDGQRLARAPLGAGAVLRGMDSRTLVRPATIDRITQLAADASIPLQVGVTAGGTDASPFSEIGAIDVGLSWPGRYSHSPVEVTDLGDVDALIRLIVKLAKDY